MSHVSWPDIVGFDGVRRAVTAYPSLLRGRSTVTYRGKIKLHGDNHGVQIKNGGRVRAQSRTTMLAPGEGHHGFAAWLASDPVTSAFEAANKDNARDYVLYGEWCGSGVQRGTALNQLTKKLFAVFAASPLTAEGESEPEALIVEPDELARFVRGVPD
ncbi:MAG: RNA ligase family protein, partial [Polyangiales bacterium]